MSTLIFSGSLWVWLSQSKRLPCESLFFRTAPHGLRSHGEGWRRDGDAHHSGGSSEDVGRRFRAPLAVPLQIVARCGSAVGCVSRGTVAITKWRVSISIPTPAIPHAAAPLQRCGAGRDDHKRAGLGGLRRVAFAFTSRLLERMWWWKRCNGEMQG